jgi:hypothetical protein
MIREMARRSNSQRIGQRSAIEAMRLLIDAGCAVNSLAEDDVGYDLHAILPTEYPAENVRSWSMSDASVLVQVKGGRQVASGVSLSKERWLEYLAKAEPTFVAAIPSGDPWIASVYELVPSGIEHFADGERICLSPTEPSWNAESFVGEALIYAAIGTPGDRRWWQAQLPQIVEDEAEQAEEILSRLMELAILDAGSAPRAGQEVDLSSAESFVVDLLKENERTAAVLREQDRFDGDLVRDLDLGGSTFLSGDGSLDDSAIEEIYCYRRTTAQRSAGQLWELFELRLARM